MYRTVIGLVLLLATMACGSPHLQFDAATEDRDGNPLSHTFVLFYLDNTDGTDWVSAACALQPYSGVIHGGWAVPYDHPENPWVGWLPEPTVYVDDEGREWHDALVTTYDGWGPTWYYLYEDGLLEVEPGVWVPYYEAAYTHNVVPPGVAWYFAFRITGSAELFNSPAVGIVDWDGVEHVLCDYDRKPNVMIVPEPSTTALLALGGIGLALRRRKLNNHPKRGSHQRRHDGNGQRVSVDDGGLERIY